MKSRQTKQKKKQSLTKAALSMLSLETRAHLVIDKWIDREKSHSKPTSNL